MLFFSHLRNKNARTEFHAGGLSRLAEVGTRGTLLRTRLHSSDRTSSCCVTTRATHVCSGLKPTFGSSLHRRFLISQAIIRHTRARARRGFYLYFGVTGRRHVKEINRGMRPPRPRRIFTRAEEAGATTRLLNIF